MNNGSYVGALAEHVVARRLTLGLNQDDLVKHGGPSRATVRNIEQGARGRYASRTLVAVDVALGWQIGSAQAVFGGGEPTVLDEHSRNGQRRLRQQHEDQDHKRAASSYGPVNERVAANVTAFRRDRKLAKSELARMVTALGRPMTLDVVTKLEDGDRRIDVDDLLALALALDVSPTRLYLVGHEQDDVALTPTTVAPARRAWRWALGHCSLSEGAPWEGLRFRDDSRPSYVENE